MFKLQLFNIGLCLFFRRLKLGFVLVSGSLNAFYIKAPEALYLRIRVAELLRQVRFFRFQLRYLRFIPLNVLFWSSI